MTSKRVGGRPPAYSETQLTDAIDALEAGGAVPTAGLVKQYFVEQFGVSTGINEQSLGAARGDLIRFEPLRGSAPLHHPLGHYR